MTETTPDADEIERARNLVKTAGMAIGFDRNRPYWKLFLAAETLLRALDAGTAERDALRAEAERYREALKWYASEDDERDKFLITDENRQPICEFVTIGDRARAALNPQPDAKENNT